MTTITKTERKTLYAEAEKSRAMYRWACALPWAIALLALIGAGMLILK